MSSSRWAAPVARGMMGTVTVTNTGGITTSGDGAEGIYAQSIGGGGGSGGNGIIGATGLFGSPVGAYVSDALTPLAVVGTSGFLRSRATVSVGGSSGSSGNGNAVLVTNSGAISTQGTQTDGVFAQSIGGGGGQGGIADSGLLGTLALGGAEG